MIVVDASVIVSATLEDEHTATADSIVDLAVESGAMAPGNFIDPTKSEILLSDLLDLPIETESPTPRTVLAAARTYGLTAYDAAYLALAVENQVPLATVDAKLAAAVKKAGCEWKPG